MVHYNTYQQCLLVVPLSESASDLVSFKIFNLFLILFSGDRILAVNDERVEGATHAQVVSLIRQGGERYVFFGKYFNSLY